VICPFHINNNCAKRFRSPKADAQAPHHRSPERPLLIFLSRAPTLPFLFIPLIPLAIEFLHQCDIHPLNLLALI
jgi:hypothetical protein